MISGYMTIGQILDKPDISGTNSADNNLDNKKFYTKADLSTYNVASVNASIGTSNTSVIGK